MAIEAPVESGHTVTTSDTINVALLNKLFDLAVARVPTPIAVSKGGTGATTAQNAQKQIQAFGRIEGWVQHTDAGTPVTLGTLPADSFITEVKIHVITAFTGTGADTIEVGWSADQDAVSTSQDVSSTGVKEPTHGANDGYNSSQQTVTALYTDANADAGAGKALVVIEYCQVTTQP